MKKLMLAIAAVSGLVVFAAEPTVSNVKMQQRYPWNALVDIDYEISGDVEGVSVAFTVSDRQNDQTYQPTKFLSAPTVVVGKNRATWDTVAEGVNIISTNVTVTVSLLKSISPVAPDNKLYMVIDLSGGTAATSYPVSYLSAVPDGGWTDEYKTTKLVLRRIEPGTFLMGRSAVSTTITKPFYIGVFETTQKQYGLVAGEENNPSRYRGDIHPVERVSYNVVRGSQNGSQWPASSAVDDSSFFGKIRAKTSIDTLDLPTLAQGEYACRAGTTSLYNNGGSTEEDLKLLARYGLHNGSPSRGAVDVGSYLPNAWGLYDMHGNVQELCLDWWSDSLAGGNDPQGPASGTHRVARGGGWSSGSGANGSTDDGCTSYARGGVGPSDYEHDSHGFRICCPAGE